MGGLAPPSPSLVTSLKIDNRNYLILSSNLKTYLFTYILHMKQSSAFVVVEWSPGVKKLSPLRILIRFGRSPKGLLTPLDALNLNTILYT